MTDLNAIARVEPDQKLFLDTTSAQTTVLTVAQRSIIVNGSVGANQHLVKLPPPGLAEGAFFDFAVTGSTGTLKVLAYPGTSWVVDANTATERLLLFCTGKEYRYVVGDGD